MVVSGSILSLDQEEFMVKAFIFDFGRVISAPKPEALFRNYERELGLAPGTINTIMFESEAWQDALIGRKTAREFWVDIGPRLGLHSERAIERFWRRYEADEAPHEEVIDLIRRLHGRYKLAVLSNSPPGLVTWLAEWGILHLFDVVFCSGDEHSAKPDPAVFKTTLERLGLRPEETAFIDDTLEHVEAARALGLHGILFRRADGLARDVESLISKQAGSG